MREYPEYLEASDNEDSGDICDCGEPAYDEAPPLYQGLCFECYADESYNDMLERRAEDRRERDWDTDYYGEDY